MYSLAHNLSSDMLGGITSLHCRRQTRAMQSLMPTMPLARSIDIVTKDPGASL